jgi:hypothetical protein
MSKEMCYNCGYETGNAGEEEDSLMLEGEPYCDDCYNEEILNIIDRKNDLQRQLEEAREEALKYKIKYNNQSSDILRLKQSKKDQTELIRKLKDEKK